jgi:hypothetical protein
VGKSLSLRQENSSSFKSAGILLLDAANHAAKLSKTPLPLAVMIQAEAGDIVQDQLQARQSFAPVVARRLRCPLSPAGTVQSTARIATARNRAEAAAAVDEGVAMAEAIETGGDTNSRSPEAFPFPDFASGHLRFVAI